MQSNGHYYTALTVLASKGFVSDWIGFVHDCYILHASSLENQFSPFCSEFPLKKFNESDEDIPLELKHAIVPLMLVEKQKASSAHVIALAHSS